MGRENVTEGWLRVKMISRGVFRRAIQGEKEERVLLVLNVGKVVIVTRIVTGPKKEKERERERQGSSVNINLGK